MRGRFSLTSLSFRLYTKKLERLSFSWKCMPACRPMWKENVRLKRHWTNSWLKSQFCCRLRNREPLPHSSKVSTASCGTDQWLGWPADRRTCLTITFHRCGNRSRLKVQTMTFKMCTHFFRSSNMTSWAITVARLYTLEHSKSERVRLVERRYWLDQAMTRFRKNSLVCTPYIAGKMPCGKNKQSPKLSIRSVLPISSKYTQDLCCTTPERKVVSRKECYFHCVNERGITAFFHFVSSSYLMSSDERKPPSVIY